MERSSKELFSVSHVLALNLTLNVMSAIIGKLELPAQLAPRQTPHQLQKTRNKESWSANENSVLNMVSTK